MDTISERLNFLVSTIEGGNSKKFAEKSNINPGTLHNYLKGRAPSTEAVINICRYFNVDSNWLLTGIGEPFLRETFGPPETLSGQLHPPSKKTAPINMEGDERRWDETSLGKAVDQLRKIYDSGDGTLIRAINANLDAFTRTVDLADEVKSLKNRMAVMESSMKKMEKIIEELGRREECCVHALAESGPPEVDPHK
jgi:transcriptional regulator with XRE-family HTH domain